MWDAREASCPRWEEEEETGQVFSAQRDPTLSTVQSTFVTAELLEQPRYDDRFRSDNDIAVTIVATTATETYRYHLTIFTDWMKLSHELWDKYNYYVFLF